MTSTQRRCVSVAFALLCACTSGSVRQADVIAGVDADGARIVVVYAPGLDSATLNGHDLPNLSALSTVEPLQNPVPGHASAVLATLYSGQPASTHGVFDNTSRVPNSYERTASQTALPISAVDDVVHPPTFDNAVDLVPFWKTLGETGISTSILFAPALLPVNDYGVRFVAGGLPSLTGKSMDPVVLVPPGQQLTVPSQPPIDEQFEEDKNEEADAEQLAESEVARATEPVSEPDGVVEMTPLSEGVWLVELPLIRLDESTLRATIVLRERGDTLAVRAGERDFQLRVGEHSPYLRLEFTAGRRSAVGRTRLHFLSAQPLKVFAEAVTVDPERPAFSVSTPGQHAAELVGRAGYGPLGESGAWSRLGGGAFTTPEFRAERIQEEAEWRLRAAASELESTDARVVLVHLEAFRRANLLGEAPRKRIESRPVRRRARPEVESKNESLGLALDSALKALDRGVGMLRARLSETDVLLVVGASRFSPAKRGLDLNGWLVKKRYLKLTRDGEIDWEKSQAYAAGDGGIYLNVKGREPKGTVSAVRGGRIASRIARDLRGLRDRGTKVVTEVWVADVDFAGPRRGAAPDVMVALTDGYAIANTLDGGETFFRDLLEPRASGPLAELDGVVLSNRPLAVSDPKLEDVAATTLVFAGVNASSPSGRAWFAPPTDP